MTLLEKLQTTCKPKQPLLLAISGGIDSVVLCQLLHKMNMEFSMAHCNFQLRGTESERDQEFVKELANKYGRQLFLKRFDTEQYAKDNKLSIQVAARNLRYEWFREIAKDGKAYSIATAHHADDNVETVVMNFFRGTGLRGLTGIQNHNNTYRPLLHIRKQEIVAYAQQHDLTYVEDSSNASDKYTRNFFRNDLLPSIKKVFPGVEENILKNINRFNEIEEVYTEAIKQFELQLIVQVGIEEHIGILKLKKTKPLKTVLWEILQKRNFTAAQVDEVIRLMDAQNGSYISSSTHRIIKNRKWLILTKLASVQESQHTIIDLNASETEAQIDSLHIEKRSISSNFTIPASPNIACFDAGKIEFPLLLRKWKTGDYFYPLGMKKKKKLSRFFIDQKLSRTQKEEVHVLEMNKKIIWVIGLRIDDRFKMVANTKNIIKITSAT